MSVQSASRANAALLVDSSSATIKRIAWAFGCAKKDSDEEIALYRILRDRFAQILAGERR